MIIKIKLLLINLAPQKFDLLSHTNAQTVWAEN
jgi:hypothetical protein